MKDGELTRDVIIQKLVDALGPLEYVHAFWEGGAAAFDRIDEWSDIDAYLLVDDEKVSDTFLVVEKALRSLSPIKQKYEKSQLPWPGVSQAFYKLKKASEYLLIDLAVLTFNATEKFLEPEIHGNSIFHFNKSNNVRPFPLTKDLLIKKLMKRTEILKAEFDLFNSFVQKAIYRGNFLEALWLYQNITLGSLIEALRIRYNPLRYDFKICHIHHDLPPRVISSLQKLFFMKDEKKLQGKYNEASRWFHKVISEIDQKGIALGHRSRATR